jgi:hypothetical protein
MRVYALWVRFIQCGGEIGYLLAGHARDIHVR